MKNLLCLIGIHAWSTNERIEKSRQVPYNLSIKTRIKIQFLRQQGNYICFDYVKHTCERCSKTRRQYNNAYAYSKDFKMISLLASRNKIKNNIENIKRGQ